MSLKPPKKSDAGKSWMSRRRDIRKDIHPEYHLIVTEGTKTEPNYFNSIKNCINLKFKERIHLHIIGEGDNTVNLFEKAQKRVKENPNGYSHVWIVYDTDDFPQQNIDRVPELCKIHTTSECQYHAIWSNQCIELWYLLHFSFMHSDLHRSEYYSKLDKYLAEIGQENYKKNREDMFTILRPYLDDAIRNAKRLQEINNNNPPSCSAPGTKVFEFMEKIRVYL